MSDTGIRPEWLRNYRLRAIILNIVPTQCRRTRPRKVASLFWSIAVPLTSRILPGKASHTSWSPSFWLGKYLLYSGTIVQCYFIWQFLTILWVISYKGLSLITHVCNNSSTNAPPVTKSIVFWKMCFPVVCCALYIYIYFLWWIFRQVIGYHIRLTCQHSLSACHPSARFTNLYDNMSLSESVFHIFSSFCGIFFFGHRVPHAEHVRTATVGNFSVGKSVFLVKYGL